MEFFDFANRESFLFFERYRKEFPVETLVADAYAEAEQFDWPRQGECPSVMARDILANLIATELDKVTVSNGDAILAGLWEEGTDLNAGELARDLLAHAVSQIDPRSVATALLASVGKWNPATNLLKVE